MQHVHHYGGIHPGQTTEGKNGRFTSQGKADLANTIMRNKPLGFDLLRQLAAKVKSTRGEKSTTTRKLGNAPAGKEAREILRNTPYREAVSQRFDVAIHYENGKVDKVYMAISKAILKIPKPKV